MVNSNGIFSLEVLVKTIIFLISLLCSLTACVSGDKLDSKLKYLNGDSYQKKSNILMVPVLETKDQESKKR